LALCDVPVGDFESLSRPIDSARLSASNGIFYFKNWFFHERLGQSKFVESTPHCHAAPVIYAGSLKINFVIKSGINLRVE
jgi:hypothetical protein